MKVSGKFKFMGVECRPGYRDPLKMNYIVGLAQGLDTLRLYVERVDYDRYCMIEPFTDVEAVLDYNPVAKEVAYSMRLLDIKQ